jgi:hypothetical protein
MKKMLTFLKQLRVLLFAAAETGFAMVGFIVVVYLLLGADSGDFVLSVMTNISLLVDAVTPQAFVGAALVLGFITLLRRR